METFRSRFQRGTSDSGGEASKGHRRNPRENSEEVEEGSALIVAQLCPFPTLGVSVSSAVKWTESPVTGWL